MKARLQYVPPFAIAEQSVLALNDDLSLYPQQHLFIETSFYRLSGR